MYFKIQGTYFKIYALYFLPLQMFDKQQLKRKYIKGGKCVSIKLVWKICAFLFRMAGKGCFTKTVCNKKRCMTNCVMHLFYVYISDNFCQLSVLAVFSRLCAHSTLSLLPSLQVETLIALCLSAPSSIKSSHAASSM